ncbi:hypothetical protein DSM112329_00312 [Paraconexibacter sp. AEG42_29]|uniref:Uncharacterized protein n=1 Tax=Paraconexibacter sp. AEG42_29 TaxID=2997339 RepID=A0AAU7APC3_9ACTN
MSTKQFAAILGFGFAVVWITLGLGDAVLCLIGAGAFAVAVAIALGEIDLAELQSRLGPDRDMPFGDQGGPRGGRRVQ